jgi:nucleoside-diphosphate-sugar epimerase
MRVFVTGASGFVGSAVTSTLIERGHQVTGLVRSEESAATVERLGATPLRGDLTDGAVLIKGAEAADGVIHCGFIHDWSNFANSIAVDAKAIETLGSVLSSRPLLVTSGVAGLSFGRPSTEDDVPDPHGYQGAQRLSEPTGMAQAERGVIASVVRLAPTVHGDGDHGFVPGLIAIARQKGVSAYVEGGENRWPAIHRLDAATLYALAIETPEAGRRYHAIAEEGIPFRAIAEVIGRKLNLPVTSLSRTEAPAHFTWMAQFAQMDVPASSAQTAERLGWTPTGPGLLEDLENGTYFD